MFVFVSDVSTGCVSCTIKFLNVPVNVSQLWLLSCFLDILTRGVVTSSKSEYSRYDSEFEVEFTDFR